jgi:hypothetical protein
LLEVHVRTSARKELDVDQAEQMILTTCVLSTAAVLSAASEGDKLDTVTCETSTTPAGCLKIPTFAKPSSDKRMEGRVRMKGWTEVGGFV